MSNTQKTPLYDDHKKRNAKFTIFAGWVMPLQFRSILEEHMAVRQNAGIFDTSHMGQIHISGKDAVPFLERLTPNFIHNQKIHQVRYNAILNKDGGIEDDVTIFREAEHSFLIIVNAANTEKVYAYLRNEQSDLDIAISNVSPNYVMIALQGPNAVEYAKEVLPGQKSLLEELEYYNFLDTTYNNSVLRVSRTGYTGEDGFEFLGNADTIIALWRSFLSLGVQPCGLGARDSLRLEAMYPLYGHELKSNRTPVESGIGWIVKEKEIEYYGKTRLLHQKKNNPDSIILPFIMSGGGIPREGYKVFSFGESPEEIGVVESGVFSPVLKKGIGTAFLPYSYREAGKKIYIQIRDKYYPAEITVPPFVTGSAKKKS